MIWPFEALTEYVLLEPAVMLSATSLYVPLAAKRIGYVPSVPGNDEGKIAGVNVRVGEGGGVGVTESVDGKEVDITIESAVGVEKLVEGSGVRMST